MPLATALESAASATLKLPVNPESSVLSMIRHSRAGSTVSSGILYSLSPNLTLMGALARISLSLRFSIGTSERKKKGRGFPPPLANPHSRRVDGVPSGLRGEQNSDSNRAGLHACIVRKNLRDVDRDRVDLVRELVIPRYGLVGRQRELLSRRARRIVGVDIHRCQIGIDDDGLDLRGNDRAYVDFHISGARSDRLLDFDGIIARDRERRVCRKGREAGNGDLRRPGVSDEEVEGQRKQSRNELHNETHSDSPC